MRFCIIAVLAILVNACNDSPTFIGCAPTDPPTPCYISP